MIGEADDGFKPGEAVPAELPLELGELIDPAAVETMPVMAGGDVAELARQFTFDNRRTCVFDHGWNARFVLDTGLGQRTRVTAIVPRVSWVPGPSMPRRLS